MSDAKTATEKKGRFGVGLIFFGAGFILMFLVGWLVFPELLYSKKNQPIDFSHRVHIEEAGMDCSDCHAFRDDGSFTGIPPLATCLDCHEEVMGENPEEARFVKEYVVPGIEVPWLSYSRQPDCVYFSHTPHVISAEMECATCHGPHAEGDHPPVYEENRITGYSRDIYGRRISMRKVNSWDRMKMNDCAQCHEEHGTSNACFVCHK